MRNKKFVKGLTVASLSVAVTFAGSIFVYGAGQALPEGTVVNQGGAIYLTDSQGNPYSGWYMDGRQLTERNISLLHNALKFLDMRHQRTLSQDIARGR